MFYRDYCTFATKATCLACHKGTFTFVLMASFLPCIKMGPFNKAKQIILEYKERLRYKVKYMSNNLHPFFQVI